MDLRGTTWTVYRAHKVRDGSSRKGLAMGPFLNNVSFHSVSLDIVMVRAKPLMRRIMSGVAELFEGHHLVSVPQPVHVYPLAELKSALRYMQGGKSNGKVVIEMRDSDENHGSAVAKTDLFIR